MEVHALNVRLLPISKKVLAKLVLKTASHVLLAIHALNAWITMLFLRINASYAAKLSQTVQYAHLIKYVPLAQNHTLRVKANALVALPLSATAISAMKYQDAPAAKVITS